MHLMKRFILLALVISGFSAKAFGQICPPNIDFETGTMAVWQYYTGIFTGGSTVATPNGPAPVATWHDLVSGPGTDPYGGFPLMPMGGGSYALRLGNGTIGARAHRATYNVHVPTGAGSYSLIYNFAMVLEDPGHAASQQPRMLIRAFDSATGSTVSCYSYNYTATSSLPGFVSIGSGRYYLPWMTSHLNLNSMAGHTVSVDFVTTDCSPTGHFGYGYVDMACGLFMTSTLSCASSSATLSAPPGYASYRWCDSLTYGTTYGLTQNVSVIAPGVRTSYAVILTPYSGYGCPDTLYSALVPISTCSGTPTAGYAYVTTATACGAPDTISLGGYTMACGLNFQWQSSPDGTTWTNITGANMLSYPYYSVYTATYYRCVVTCSATGFWSASTPVYVPFTAGHALYTVLNPPDTICNGAVFYVSTCAASTAFRVASFYGDGTADTNLLSTTGVRHATIYHSYAYPGTYTVKQILYDGTLPVDSTTFSHNYRYCSTIPIKLYYDTNLDSSYTAGEDYLSLPSRIAVDSNGFPIDTVSVISGIYYRTYGPPGTVYGFRVLSVSSGLFLTSPTTGVIHETILPYVNLYATRYFGFNCSSVPGYDLTEHMVVEVNGQNDQYGHIYVTNSNCAASAAVATLYFSPKWAYTGGAYPAPVSSTSTSVTWNVSGSITSPLSIYYVLWSNPLTGYLTIGDTVLSTVTVTPTAGDVNLSNNTETRIDTVRGGCDPNFIEVKPPGCVPSDTTLVYNIHFENTGNDTAHNIYVLDTLPNNVDPGTMILLGASSTMNIAHITSGGLNIVKFDFPGINLLDSSHHGLCDGMVFFKIKTRHSLATGTTLFNRAGIYFDINPVVMTNEVENIISPNPATGVTTGPSSVCTGSTIALANAATGGVWTCTNSHATVSATGVVTGVSGGVDTVLYTVSNLCHTQFAVASKIVTVSPTPGVHSVTGGGSYCTGGTGMHIGMAGSDAGIDYQLFRSASAVGAPLPGTGTTLDFGVLTIAGTYTVTATRSGTGCARGMTGSAVITVLPPVVPAVTISTGGTDTVCGGIPVTFSAFAVNGGTTPTYVWKVNGTVVGSMVNYTYTPASGDLVSQDLTSSALCATPVTVSDAVTMTVVPPSIPMVSVTASPGTTISIGETVTLTAGVTGTGYSNTYQWIRNSTPIVGATNSVYVSSTFVNHDSITCAVGSTGVCGGYASTSSVVLFESRVGTILFEDNQSLSIFPNPNNGSFTIRGAVSKGGDETVSVEITNLPGQIVYQGNFQARNGVINEQMKLLSSMAPGMYLLMIKSATEKKVIHFSIEK